MSFLRRHAVATARCLVPLPFGFGALDDELTHVWDLNFVWVDDASEIAPGGLAAAADRVLGRAGLAHRQIVVADEDGGERLAPGFAALSWSATRHVLMAHARNPDRPAEAGAAEMDQDALRPFRRAFLEEDPLDNSPETQRQLLEAPSRHAAMRSFGASVDGRVVSAADLYEDGAVAQIESVMTLKAYRNRGLARAVVLCALAAARADGAALVFLQAEADDWPMHLYRRLGFDPVGLLWLFQRKP